MKKHLLLLAFAATTAMAQTDVTATYLQNPSFELDDISSLTVDATRGAYTATSVVGWTLSGSYGVSDIMTADATATDNNFGTPGSPSDGTQMYYIRNAWSASTASLMQDITLPAGNYRLTVDNKCITASSHSASIIAGSAQTALTFQSSMPSDWTTTTVNFTLDAETTISVGLQVVFGSGSGGSVLIDNYRLYELPEDYVEPEDPTEESVSSYTEGVITHDFVAEADMMQDLLQMIARFSEYMQNDFFDCEYTNSVDEECGYFNGESSGQANEAGVRTNADLGMLCAFLVKYAQPAGISLPDGVTWSRIKEMAIKSLVFAYSTHKANKLKVCAGSTSYWGSVSTSDYTWESSLWAMSVAYSTYFLWDELTEQQRTYVYNVLKAECNYELGRTIPTGYSGDTKAEENGWEADILAATLGLFPDDDLAESWYQRMRQFAINSYSHYSDASNTNVIDPTYDGSTVADLYQGVNLYPDYTLQNHNLFHTSYQNVVMQELGEAALALQMFQGDSVKWSSNALMHNNQQVMDSVLNWLALSDGELAMPNGNDWSLFLYDQITSYSTQACFQRDANALMLENLAYKYIKARQQTTDDGSWLLRPDVSARRMGVEGHRVMMTYLMHLHNSTADLTPTNWDDFRERYAEAKILPNQNVVRAFSPSRFTTFSWSTGLSSYTGYFASNTPDKNKIVVPYRANNTGNLLGWYTVSGQSTNATPVVSGIYELNGMGYTMNGELNTNGSTLNNRFALYSTPGNALIYLDNVQANSAVTITGEYGGMLAISTDELMKEQRTVYYEGTDTTTHKQTDGSSLLQAESDWANIDNELGVVGKNGKGIAFGDRSANNSIYTSKLYPMYSATSRSVASGASVDQRHLVYYSSVSAATTRQLASLLQTPDGLSDGWNAIIAADPDSTRYLLIANFRGTSNEHTLSGLQVGGLAPVLPTATTIEDNASSATFTLQQNHSVGSPLHFLLLAESATAQLSGDSAAYITANKAGDVTIKTTSASTTLAMSANQTILVTLNADGTLSTQTTEAPEAAATDPTSIIINPKFREGTNGWSGSPTVNYNCAEKYNTTFNVYQELSGLEPGNYELSVQGFYRYGSTSNAATTHANGTEKLQTLLYAIDGDGTEVSTPLASIIEEADALGNVGVEATGYGYVPNTMAQADLYFTQGLYPNKLDVVVGDDGTLTIGVKKTATQSTDWAIFTNFQLTYLGATDAIQSTTAATPSNNQRRYSLSGIALYDDAQPQGIYIQGGKKVVR